MILQFEREMDVFEFVQISHLQACRPMQSHLPGLILEKGAGGTAGCCFYDEHFS
jgi:hypothetical protein